jgi:two-component system OmpR family sensor kinase
MKRLTLRRRLVIGIVALLAAITLVIGVVSVFALQGFLMNRLDAQLDAATNRSQDTFDDDDWPTPPDEGDRPEPSPDTFLALSGQPTGTLGAIVRSGEVVTVAVLDDDGRPVLLDATAFGSLAMVPSGASPSTTELTGGLGEYRVVAQDDARLDGTLVIGLPLSDVRATVVQLAVLIAVIGALAVALAAAVGALVVRLALRPLERVAATATRVSELPLDRDVDLAVRVDEADADPATEVGRVGAALNRMLEHVASALAARQASENKVRTFVADASHELRTPLASIRGYSELTRRTAQELPPDVAHAVGRIESESVRMTGLVEDLLLLARLDEGGRLPDTSEVDLGRLLVDAVSDARVAGGDHTWRLDVPDAPVTVPGEASRLHQIVANLLANARTHTPPGTLVETSLELRDDEAIISVADDGPGIDAALVPTVFERFVRGDGSRSRASGSTGLGLAIVHAVVEAHGGRAEVESAPGRTVFRIMLPAAPHT